MMNQVIRIITIFLITLPFLWISSGLTEGGVKQIHFSGIERELSELQEEQRIQVVFISGTGIQTWEAPAITIEELDRLAKLEKTGVFEQLLNLIKSALNMNQGGVCRIVIMYEAGEFAHVEENCGLDFDGYGDSVKEYVAGGDNEGFAKSSLRFVKLHSGGRIGQNDCSSKEFFNGEGCETGRSFLVPIRSINLVGAEVLHKCEVGEEPFYRVFIHTPL